jgi:phosphomethylpyrimidine synthase
MKISHDIRDEAERVAGLETQKQAYRQAGSQIYIPAAEPAPAAE